MATNENDRETWLAKVNEAALEPELPIIDPHHHLWDHPGSRYLLDEIVRDTALGPSRARYRVRRVPLDVSRGRTGADAAGWRDRVRQRHRGSERERAIRRDSCRGRNRQLCGFGTRSRRRRSVAGAYRCRAGAFPWHSSCGRLRREPGNQELAHQPARRFVRVESVSAKVSRSCASLNLSFEAWQYHPQMSMVTSLAKAFPDTTIMLDHFGGPLGIGPYEGRRAEIFHQWKKSITELGECPNVVAKLGGINMAVNGFGWHRRPSPPTSDELVSATREYYLHTIDRSGLDDVCSRVTSRLTGARVRTSCCGTRSRGWRRASPRTRKRMTVPSHSIGSVSLKRERIILSPLLRGEDKGEGQVRVSRSARPITCLARLVAGEAAPSARVRVLYNTPRDSGFCLFCSVFCSFPINRPRANGPITPRTTLVTND